MKKKLPFLATAAVSSLLTVAVAGPALAAFIPGSTSVQAGGAPAIPETDYKFYVLDEDTCTTALSSTMDYPLDFSPAHNAVFHGTAMPCIEGIIPGPGSHMELGPEVGTFPANATVLSGNLPSHGKVALSNLLEQDWNHPIGPLTLTQKYIADAIFVGCGINYIDAGKLSDLAQLLIMGKYAARLSDPNIAFVNEDFHKKITLGLMGRYDISTLIPMFADCPDPLPNPDLPQASEVVKFTHSGKRKAAGDTYLYSFFGVPSGINGNDPSDPHSAIYTVSPTNEPPLGEKVGEIVEDSSSLILSWIMTLTNPNPTSVAVKIADPIRHGQDFYGDPMTDVTCEGMLVVPGLVDPICEYDAVGNQVRFEGFIPPGGIVTISFEVTAHHLPTSNTASMCWDRNVTGTSPDVRRCKREIGKNPIRIKGTVGDFRSPNEEDDDADEDEESENEDD